MIETMTECAFDEKFIQISGNYNTKQCADFCVETQQRTKYIILTVQSECFCSTFKPVRHCVFENAQVLKVRGSFKILLSCTHCVF